MTTSTSWRAVASALGLGALLWIAAALAESPAGADISAGEMALLTAVDSADISRSTQWEPVDPARLAQWRGPFLLRYRVRFAAVDTTQPQAIVVSLRAAFVATWDGVPLAPNGSVGVDETSERPGRVDWIAPVPQGVAGIGEHELLFRASSAHGGTQFRRASVAVGVAPLAAFVLHRQRAWLLPALALGALLTAGLSSFAAVARSATRSSGRELMVLVASAAGLTIAEAWRPLIGYTYPWHAVRLRVILLLTALTMLFLVRYLLRQRGAPAASTLNRTTWLLLGAFATIAAVAPTYDFAALWMHATGVGVSLGLNTSARRNESGHDPRFLTPLLAVSMLTILFAPLAWLDGLSVIALATMLVVVLLTHTTRLREQAARASGLEHTRQRLTTALIRRSIQPHWLMNTLTALQELIERDPARASSLVDALAEEFRIVTDASQRAWITGAQELALCRAHLTIVSHAMLSPRELLVTGEALLADILLPPGVLHALLENGLTHAGVASADGAAYALHCRLEADALSLTFESPLSNAYRDGMPVRRGTGTQFVEASLEAAFPGDWSFTQTARGGRWEARIRLSLAALRAARAQVETSA